MAPFVDAETREQTTRWIRYNFVLNIKTIWISWPIWQIKGNINFLRLADYKNSPHTCLVMVFLLWGIEKPSTKLLPLCGRHHVYFIDIFYKTQSPRSGPDQLSCISDFQSMCIFIGHLLCRSHTHIPRLCIKATLLIQSDFEQNREQMWVSAAIYQEFRQFSFVFYE